MVDQGPPPAGGPSPPAGGPSPDVTLHRKATWGPVQLATGTERVRAWTPNSPVVTIEVPPARGVAEPTTLQALRDGVEVLADGQPALTLVQPRRGWLRRRGRAIEVHGPPELVPPSTVLRARGWFSMGLETTGPPARRLVRPHLDLLDAPFLWGFTAGTPQVDQDVHPVLLATWAAASWHLIAAVHQ